MISSPASPIVELVGGGRIVGTMRCLLGPRNLQVVRGGPFTAAKFQCSGPISTRRPEAGAVVNSSF